MSSSNEFCLLSCDPHLTFTWPSPDLDLDQSLTKTFGQGILSPEPRSESGSGRFIKYSHPPPPHVMSPDWSLCPLNGHHVLWLIINHHVLSFLIVSRHTCAILQQILSSLHLIIPLWDYNIMYNLTICIYFSFVK